MLIDSGNPGGRDAARIHRVATEQAGLKRIDHAIITHFHVDHFGGLAELADLMPETEAGAPPLPDPEVDALVLSVSAELGFTRREITDSEIVLRCFSALVNDLAVILLRDHLAEVLGVDPLSPDGMSRWATDVVAAYTLGVFRTEEP